MVLHTVNSPPHSSTCLADCLNVISAPAVLLLIEDGVYAATQTQSSLFEALPAGIECYVLQADVDARGLCESLSARFNPVDDGGFVELTVRCQQIQSWY